MNKSLFSGTVYSHLDCTVVPASFRSIASIECSLQTTWCGTNENVLLFLQYPVVATKKKKDNSSELNMKCNFIQEKNGVIYLHK